MRRRRSYKDSGRSFRRARAYSPTYSGRRRPLDEFVHDDEDDEVYDRAGPYARVDPEEYEGPGVDYENAGDLPVVGSGKLYKWDINKWTDFDYARNAVDWSKRMLPVSGGMYPPLGFLSNSLQFDFGVEYFQQGVSGEVYLHDRIGPPYKATGATNMDWTIGTPLPNSCALLAAELMCSVMQESLYLKTSATDPLLHSPADLPSELYIHLMIVIVKDVDALLTDDHFVNNCVSYTDQTVVNSHPWGYRKFGPNSYPGGTLPRDVIYEQVDILAEEVITIPFKWELLSSVPYSVVPGDPPVVNFDEQIWVAGAKRASTRIAVPLTHLRFFRRDASRFATNHPYCCRSYSYDNPALEGVFASPSMEQMRKIYYLDDKK